MGWGEGGEFGFGHCELEVPVDFWHSAVNARLTSACRSGHHLKK